MLLGWCRRPEAIAEKGLHPIDEFGLVVRTQAHGIVLPDFREHWK